MNGIGGFWRANVLGLQKGGGDFSPSPNTRLGLAAGFTALSAGVGAAIGASRAAHDVVTLEHIPYPETVQVQVGTHQETGCYDYHFGYNYSSGGFDYHYGYDSSCKQDVPTYETRETGRILDRTVAHHTEGFPHSALQGALLGLGVGAVTSTLALALSSALRQ